MCATQRHDCCGGTVHHKTFLLLLIDENITLLVYFTAWRCSSRTTQLYEDKFTASRSEQIFVQGIHLIGGYFCSNVRFQHLNLFITFQARSGRSHAGADGRFCCRTSQPDLIPWNEYCMSLGAPTRQTVRYEDREQPKLYINIQSVPRSKHSISLL